MNRNILICPVCGKDLYEEDKAFVCRNGHSFDKAKEGYVNLLAGSHKSGDKTGDNKSMAALRRDFLNKGYFSSLADAVIGQIKKTEIRRPTVLDICCGEGYYSQQVLTNTDSVLYGFDLSKSMVRLAAKRKTGGTFFVANLSHIPVKDESVDTAFHLFAPFHEKEFARVLKKGGTLITAVPGENHLFGLKEAVYEKPYKNDERLPETAILTLTDTVKVKNEITLESADDIAALFGMTPYYYKTSPADRAKLLGLHKLTTQTEFVLGVYQKR
ncbi:MAG: putative RNA methyltransferase [Acutalibacteraceae bacterium]